MLNPGDIFEQRFQIVTVLGQGGGGVVYRARQTDVGRDVVLKILHSQDTGDRESIKRFRREAKILSQLEHPNIVEIYHMGISSEGVPYVVMELIRGTTLRRTLEMERRIPPARAIAIARQIAEALKAIHALGVVHRDLKPENIMLCTKPAPDFVKLIDFGLAGVTERGSLNTEKLTKTGLMIGSPQYMSPEQCQGKAVDQRSDIYALGCILFEMIAGEPVFESESSIGFIHKHLSEIPPSLDKKVPGALPSGLADVVARMLEKSSEKRYKTCDEFVSDLNPVVERKWTGGSVSRVGKPAPRTSGRKISTAIVASVGMSLLGCTSLWQSQQSSPESYSDECEVLMEEAGRVTFPATWRDEHEKAFLGLVTLDGSIKQVIEVAPASLSVWDRNNDKWIYLDAAKNPLFSIEKTANGPKFQEIKDSRFFADVILVPDRNALLADNLAVMEGMIVRRGVNLLDIGTKKETPIDYNQTALPEEHQSGFMAVRRTGIVDLKGNAELYYVSSQGIFKMVVVRNGKTLCRRAFSGLLDGRYNWRTLQSLSGDLVFLSACPERPMCKAETQLYLINWRTARVFRRFSMRENGNHVTFEETEVDPETSLGFEFNSF